MTDDELILLILADDEIMDDIAERYEKEPD